MNHHPPVAQTSRPHRANSFRWTTPVLTSLLLLPAPALADTADGANTAWILTASALVLFMTVPGLALFYGGLVRTKNVLSVLMQCFAITCGASLLWFFAGYSLAFTDGGIANAWLGGLDRVLLAGMTRDSLSGSIPETLFALFQMTFAIITPALVIGGFAERMKFSAMLLFSMLWLLVVYVPVAHWVWGGGWLMQRGVLDFAGGIVVHITAGVGALVAALVGVAGRVQGRPARRAGRARQRPLPGDRGGRRAVLHRPQQRGHARHDERAAPRRARDLRAPRPGQPGRAQRGRQGAQGAWAY